jgi:hypothetical protein
VVWTTLALVAGTVLGMSVGSIISRRAFSYSSSSMRNALYGWLLALLPAFFLAIALGGNLGGAGAAWVSETLGLENRLVPAGIFVGSAGVAALFSSLGALAGGIARGPG